MEEVRTESVDYGLCTSYHRFCERLIYYNDVSNNAV